MVTLIPQLRSNSANLTGTHCLLGKTLANAPSTDLNADMILGYFLRKCEENLKESTFEKCAEKREELYCKKILSNREALDHLLVDLPSKFEKELLERLLEKVTRSTN